MTKRKTLATYGAKRASVRVFADVDAGLVRVQWRVAGALKTKSWPNTPAGREEAKAWARGFAEARIARNPSPCTPVVGDVIRTFRWSLPERGGHPREVQLTAACAGVYSEFDGLYAALDSLAFSAAATEGAQHFTADLSA